MRIVAVITLLLLLGVSYGLYQLKYQVEGLQDRAADLARQTEEDQRAIKVLQAEWAYLTRPQRLQRLSDDFLNLDLVTATQIAALDELSMPAVVEGAPEAAEPAVPDAGVPQRTPLGPSMIDPDPFVQPPSSARPSLPVDTVSFSHDEVAE